MKKTSNLISFVLLFGILSFPPPSNSAQKTRKDKKFYAIGFSQKVFLGFAAQDGKAAAKVLAQKVFDNQKLNYAPKIATFNNLQTLKKMIEKDELHIVALTSTDYCKIKEEAELFPFSIPIFFDDPFSRFALITLNSDKNTDLKNLRGKKIIVFAGDGDKNNYPFMWIDNILMKEFGETSGTFFSQIKASPKVSEVILPVFFNEFDACIATTGVFDVQADLNPQIRRKLKIIKESEEYVVAVICLTKKGKEESSESLVNAFYELHESRQGKQLLSVFRADKIIPYKEKYMKSVEKLIRENTELKKRFR